MRKTHVVLGIAVVGMISCVSAEKKLAMQREKDPQFQYEKAVVCLQYNVPDDAFKYLNQALALDPRHYLSYNLLGLAHMMKGHLPQAKQALLKCLELKPDFSEAHNNLGTVYQESNEAELAEAEFKKAVALDDNYNASYNLAKMYFQQNKFDAALENVQRSLRKYPKSVLALNLEGLIYDGLQKYETAIASFEQALKLVPNELNVSYNLAVAYYKTDNKIRAKDILDKILPQAKTEELRSKIQDLLNRLK